MSEKPIPINTEQSPALILDIIFQLKIKDVMTTNVITAKPKDKLSDIKVLMKNENITGVPIIKNDRIIGIVSIDDIITAMDKGHINETAEKHMAKKLVMLEDDMPLSFGISYFNKFKYGRFPVVNKDNILVGMLTSRNINVGLLQEIYKEVEKLEQKMYHENSMNADSNKIKKLYRIKRYDFENAGKASNEIKKILTKKNINPKDIRRIAIAMYEMEINVAVHSEGGVIRVVIDKEKADIIAKDLAPGIKDPQLALKKGYTTANEWVKSLGFGAGMGLPNIKRVSDEFRIRSSLGHGTIVNSVIYFEKEAKKNEN